MGNMAKKYYRYVDSILQKCIMMSFFTFIRHLFLFLPPPVVSKRKVVAAVCSKSVSEADRMGLKNGGCFLWALNPTPKSMILT